MLFLAEEILDGIEYNNDFGGGGRGTQGMGIGMSTLENDMGPFYRSVWTLLSLIEGPVLRGIVSSDSFTSISYLIIFQ